MKLKQIMEKIKEDKKLHTCWKCSNVMAIERMGYTDHGPTHVKIVSNIALKLLRILVDKKLITPSVVEDYGMTNDDAEVIVVLGSIMHDLGMIVQRRDHEKYSTFIAYDILQNLLTPTYNQEERVIITSEVLHSIVCHEEKPSSNTDNRVLTKEAGVVGIADALDMEAGRARIPFNSGKIDIHAVSALSIEKVLIEATEHAQKPITIKIKMTNSAGVFQIDELLKPRIIKSGLEKFFHVTAEITGEKENRIIEKFEI
ncbi:MAG: HD domain-containing protein [Crenarchaeota archaeon]|jgi:metal-dependent HD superfamily phosphatase/phosphodiesterase|nr:HD domain-containing protein [Thermoproteota archaeon]